MANGRGVREPTAFEVGASDILEPAEMPRTCPRKQALGRIAVIQEPQTNAKPQKHGQEQGMGDEFA